MIILPPRLRQGDKIGITAPAGPVSPQELQPAFDLIRSNGYVPEFSSDIFETKDYLAGDDSLRLENLHSMFRDNGIKAVICARGGYGTTRLLGRIDYDLIHSHPKIIAGYSDITALLLAVYKNTGMVTFHGPVARELGKNSNKNLKAFLDTVSGKEGLHIDLSEDRILSQGRADGILLGGNLSLICNLIGTPFLPSFKDVILFIEDKGEPLYRIDRMLTHLRYSGIIDDIAGLVTGSFEGCGSIPEIDHLLAENFKGSDFPVVSGLPAGHGTENITIPLGVGVEINTDSNILSFQEQCVAD